MKQDHMFICFHEDNFNLFMDNIDFIVDKFTQYILNHIVPNCASCPKSIVLIKIITN